MPGDSPRFDLYDGLREFLISAKRKEIHNERLPEPEPYEMGLQISRGVYPDSWLLLGKGLSVGLRVKIPSVQVPTISR